MDDGVEDNGRGKKVRRLVIVFFAEEIILVLRNRAAGSARVPPREFRIVRFFDQDAPS